MDLFRVSGRDKTKMGLKKLRIIKCVTKIGNEKKKVVVRIMKNMVLKIFNIFFPKNAKELLFAFHWISTI